MLSWSSEYERHYFHFPDTSSEYKGIDSKILLKDVMKLIRKEGFEVNIDSTICLELPKINPLISEIKQVLANCMSINQDQISIKATTSEKMGFVGEQKGVSAHAVVLINKV